MQQFDFTFLLAMSFWNWTQALGPHRNICVIMYLYIPDVYIAPSIYI